MKVKYLNILISLITVIGLFYKDFLTWEMKSY